MTKYGTDQRVEPETETDRDQHILKHSALSGLKIQESTQHMEHLESHIIINFLPVRGGR